VSSKVNLGVTLGSLVLLIFISVVVLTGSKANEEAAKQAANDSAAAKVQSIQNNIDIDKQHKALQTFIDAWERRVNVSNQVNNVSRNIDLEQERQLINLARNQSLILKQQVSNEENIIGNLTDHRIIANLSNANQTEILSLIKNNTEAITSAQYDEQAEKKVASIIGNMTKEHQIIFKALNITDKDNQIDDIAKLKKALDALEKKHGIPPGLAKK
jgi:hypothetical protein